MNAYDLSGRSSSSPAPRGIGLEAANAVHARGASVALVDLDGEATEHAAAAVASARSVWPAT